jgi:hypothetical protein
MLYRFGNISSYIVMDFEKIQTRMLRMLWYNDIENDKKVLQQL